MSDEVIIVICVAPVVAVIIGLLSMWISFKMDEAMNDQDDWSTADFLNIQILNIFLFLDLYIFWIFSKYVWYTI